jgi:hypothetical protein
MKIIALALTLVAMPVLAGPAVQLRISDCGPPPFTCTPNIRIYRIGEPIPIWIAALDANGSRATNYTGTVSLSSSNASASLPAAHTFTLADDSVFVTTVTFKTPGNLQSYLGAGTNYQWLTATDPVNNLTWAVDFILLGDPQFAVPVPALSEPWLLALGLLVAAIGWITVYPGRGLTTRSTGPAGTDLLLGERVELPLFLRTRDNA